MNTKKNLLATFVAFSVSSGAQTAIAQVEEMAQQTGRTSILEEIIVTAQKRETSIQTTPVAITAKSGDSLRDAGITNLEDINGISPSLGATNVSGLLQVTMRGVGSEILGVGIGETGVATHTNGVYQGSGVSVHAGFLDVERMEIMRGPQGTLWGRNSTGGAINVIQNRPTEEFEASVNLDYGNYNTRSIEGVVSGPLSESIQGRLAVKKRRADGFLENLLPGKSDLGDDNSELIRGSLQINLSDRSEWLLAAGSADWDIFGRATKQEGTAFPDSLSLLEGALEPSAPRGEFVTYASFDSVEDVEVSYITSEFSIDFESASLTLLTDARSNERVMSSDLDFTPSLTQGVWTVFEDEADEFSQEIRLSSLGGDALDWVVGGYYYRLEQNWYNSVNLTELPIPDTTYGGAFGPDYPGGTIKAGGVLDIESLGIFGQGSYRFNDALAATLGLRYSGDEKESESYQDFSVSVAGAAIPLGAVQASFEDSWSDWTGKIGVEYTASEDVFLFGNVSRGFKAGGINGIYGTFDEETLINYEVGVKSTLADGTLRANLTAYYSDYEGYQLQVIDEVTTIVINGDVKIAGLESEFEWRPTPTWSIDLVATFTDSEIISYGDIPGLKNPATGELAVTGEPTPRTPDFAYRIGVEKGFMLSDQADVAVNLSYTWQDDVNLDSFGTYGADQEGYGLVDLLVRLSSKDDVWSVDLYGKNLTNEFYKTGAVLYSVGLGSTVSAIVGKPRTYGVRIQTHF